jgi:hypothetical protein
LTSDEEKRKFEQEIKKLEQLKSTKEFYRTLIVDYFGKIHDSGITYIITDYFRVL